MKQPLFTLLAAAILTGSGCTQTGPSGSASDSASAGTAAPSEYVEAERIPPAAAIPESAAPTGAPGLRFREGSVRNTGTAVEVLDAGGNVIASSGDIIRAPDENDRCPAEGFRRIVAKGDYFTIEQQTCGGMSFVDEYITFKAAADGRIFLHKFSIVETDRSDPERDIPQRNLTTKEFGQIELKDVQLQQLYEML